MQPTGTLPLQDWMMSLASKAVMQALMAEGGIARFVGGCVRDAVVGRSISDIDIATTESPSVVMQLLKEYKVVGIGASHGSILAVVKGVPFHITTLRADVETFGRHARVSFVDDWKEDAKRRDLTCNALYLDLDGTLYDPCGGVEDLKQGRVRFIGDAAERIREDYLRVLRYFRFQAIYGTYPPELEALEACCQASSGLKQLSGERIWYELKRLLQVDSPVRVLQQMWSCNVFAVLFPYLHLDGTSFLALERLVTLEHQMHMQSDALRRLACMIQGNRAVAERIIERLKFSRSESKQLLTLTRILRNPPNIDDRKTMYTLLHKHGATLYREIALLLADQQINVPLDQAPIWLQRHFDSAEHWWSPELPVRGSDIIELGVPRSPKVSQLLKELEDWWLENGCRPTREKCLAWLQERI
ncbi:MAG: CCA tRNA nucleotidyltransferase [Pseudomonadota bacterium]